MDMGTGKTITTIALAGTLHHKHKITQMLVVCPKSIVDVWEQEFEKFADFPYQLAVLDGTSAKKADTIRYMIGNGLQIIVVNYESCWRLEAELTRWHPDMIVCDESSKIKNPQAKCSKALHRLGKISSYICWKDRQVRQRNGHAHGHGLPRLYRQRFPNYYGHPIRKAEGVLGDAPTNQRH